MELLDSAMLAPVKLSSWPGRERRGEPRVSKAGTGPEGDLNSWWIMMKFKDFQGANQMLFLTSYEPNASEFQAATFQGSVWDVCLFTT